MGSFQWDFEFPQSTLHLMSRESIIRNRNVPSGGKSSDDLALENYR